MSIERISILRDLGDDLELVWHSDIDGDKVIEEGVIEEILNVGAVKICVSTDLHREEGLFETRSEERPKIRIERLVEGIELLFDLCSQRSEILL